MQILKVFAVYDKKAKAYRFPHFHSQAGQAVRSFEDGVNEPNTEIAKHPEDFTLYQIGEFDDASGKISGLNAPMHIEEANNLKKDK